MDVQGPPPQLTVGIITPGTISWSVGTTLTAVMNAEMTRNPTKDGLGISTFLLLCTPASGRVNEEFLVKILVGVKISALIPGNSR